MPSKLANYYDANLALLKKHHPAVWKTMDDELPEPFGEVFLAPNGKPNLKIPVGQNRFSPLHIEGDPEAETPQFLDLVQENSTGFVAMIGMGLGYTPRAILKHRPHIRHLAVFELEPEIFRQALQHMDLSEMLADPRLILSVGRTPDIAKVLQPAERALRLEVINTLKHMPSFAYDQAAFQELSDKLFSYLNSLNVGGATLLNFGRDFMLNRASHLSSVHHNCLLENLKDAYVGRPAILVAGGPSLDKNIRLLKEAKGKAVILAADSVLPALLAHDVPPDFLSAIDPQELAYEKFADVAPVTKGVSLICMPWVNRKIPKTFPADQVFWCFSGNPMERWVNNLIGGTLLTGGAETVAHLNLMAAIIMGCSPIVLIGQDLAYSGESSHAKHTVMTNQIGMETILKSKSDTVWVKGINGSDVPTSRGLLSLKKYFEKILAEVPGKYINATEGGAHIEGTEVHSLKEVLNQYCTTSFDVAGRIHSAAPISEQTNMQKLLGEFRATLKKVKELQKVVKRSDQATLIAQKELSKIKRRGGKCRTLAELPRPLQKKITELDRFHNTIDNERKIWSLLEDLTLEGLKKSERLQHKIKKIEGDPQHYLEWLLKNLERFDQINAVRTDVLKMFEDILNNTLAFHKKESTLLRKIKLAKSGNDGKSIYELAKHYFDADDLVVAKPFFEKALENNHHSADIFLHLGFIAACQSDPGKADTYFQKATEQAPEFKKRIKAFRQQLGDNYLAYVEKFKSIDPNTLKKMLLKGLRYCPDHYELQNELKKLALEDIHKTTEALEQGVIEKVKDLLLWWFENLEANQNVFCGLNDEQRATLYYSYGKLLVSESNYQDAFEVFQRALPYQPHNPDIYISLTDVLFAQGDYDTGILKLNEAIRLDKKYALYWENIGDNMQKLGQAEDAIAAYEQCFTVLPGHLDLLKKIGDCYLAAGHTEAAREIYTLLKNRMVCQATAGV